MSRKFNCASCVRCTINGTSKQHFCCLVSPVLRKNSKYSQPPEKKHDEEDEKDCIGMPVMTVLPYGKNVPKPTRDNDAAPQEVLTKLVGNDKEDINFFFVDYCLDSARSCHIVLTNFLHLAQTWLHSRPSATIIGLWQALHLQYLALSAAPMD